MEIQYRDIAFHSQSPFRPDLRETYHVEGLGGFNIKAKPEGYEYLT
jgi:hypothetical protein